MYLVTSDQMQAFDSNAISNLGVPGMVWMDHAGKAVADVVRALQPQTVVVCAGKGNNGGDGWVAARWCRHYGLDVQVLSIAAPEALAKDARWAAETALRAGVPWRLYDPAVALPDADVYVDALLGTGASRPLTGAMQTWVEQVNAREATVVAVDVPTGVHPSTGEVPGAAVRATTTVCLAAAKLGTAVAPGCYHAGTVTVADIGIPIPDDDRWAALVTEATARALLPARPLDAHKGTFGRVAVWTGRMSGAAVLAGQAALRTGAGLVVQLTDGLPGAPPEFVFRPRTGALPLLLADCRAVVAGPGLGNAEDAPEWSALLTSFSGYVVVDAEALSSLPFGVPEVGQRLVLTPHPKECAHLLGWTTAQVQARRLQAATELARRSGAVTVLKGYHTLVADPAGRVRVNSTGGPALATAGTGDVLAGMIGALLAQGLAPFDAACLGVWLHGRAGDLAEAVHGSASVVATDVIGAIPAAIRSVSA
ncbi:MAG: NAD(P)H-hydrate dehydratase [Alicyclobacillus sp.]|nr:NAD(P)H-hydrate dehydratase [Alicyclobacillus sp.]